MIIYYLSHLFPNIISNKRLHTRVYVLIKFLPNIKQKIRIFQSQQKIKIIKLEDKMSEDKNLTNAAMQHHESHSSKTKAYLLATTSSICLVFMQIILKRLSKHFVTQLILGFRGSLLFSFNFLYLYFTNSPIHVTNPVVFRAIIKRALFSGVTMIMYLSSVKYIPIGVANALFNTTPIMTFFVEAAYYKKSIFSNSLNLLMTFVSFIGVVFIIQPSILFGNAPPDNYIFYFVVLASAFTMSFSMIFLHDLRKKVGELIVLQHGYFTQAILSYFIFMFVNTDTHKQMYLLECSFSQICKFAGLMLLLVLFAFLTQFTQAKAMYMCTPALIMPFSYVSVIFGFLIDLIVFDAKYNGLKIIGMIMASFGLFSKFLVLEKKPNSIQNQTK